MRPRIPAWPLALLLLSGCLSPVRHDVDALICDRARTPIDLPPPGAGTPALAFQKSAANEIDAALSQAAYQASAAPSAGPPRPDFLKRLEVPPAVPGSEAKKIVIPSLRGLPLEGQLKVLGKVANQNFPALPPVGPDPQPVPGPDGKPLTLADLQKLARANSPLLRQAAADVQAAKGAAVQAGLYPNPTFGVQGITAGPSGGPEYGYVFGQTIKTMGKLRLARAAAEMDVANAELAYRKAETDLMASVRSGYFGVLVAGENIRANRALVRLTDEVYKVLVQQLRGGEVATYEPMQVGVFAAQARAGLITARNSYTLAWKQLASVMGLPGMPPTELAGRIDLPLPRYRYDAALARVLGNHTDVGTAENGIKKARYNLRLAEVTAVPDINWSVTLLNDATPPGPERVTATTQVTVPVPVWDRNQGNIRQMQGALLRAVEEPHRVRADLTARLADAFRRYDESAKILELYKVDILPMQVQAFRATVQRHYGGEPGAVLYNDLIASEQNLVSAIGVYLTTLGATWQAVVDTANLLQTDDLFQLAEPVPVAPVPDLDALLQLPCCHPCDPLPDGRLRKADVNWQPAGIPPAGARKTPAATPAPLPTPQPVGTSAPTPEPRPTMLPQALSAVEPELALPALAVSGTKTGR